MKLDFQPMMILTNKTYLFDCGSTAMSSYEVALCLQEDTGSRSHTLIRFNVRLPSHLSCSHVQLHVIHDLDGMVSITDSEDDIARGDPTHSLHHLVRLSRLSPRNSQLLSPEPMHRWVCCSN